MGSETGHIGRGGGFGGPLGGGEGVWGGAQLPLEVFLVGLILVAAPYFITNNIAEARGVTVLDPEMGFDRDIPVIYWTILPYALLYLFYPVTLLVCPRDDRGRPS